MLTCSDRVAFSYLASCAGSAYRGVASCPPIKLSYGEFYCRGTERSLAAPYSVGDTYSHIGIFLDDIKEFQI